MGEIVPVLFFLLSNGAGSISLSRSLALLCAERSLAILLVSSVHKARVIKCVVSPKADGQPPS